MKDMTNNANGKLGNNRVLNKSIFWLQFIFFGGWTGIQIILQPQDLSVFVNDRGLLDNFFFTFSYSWQNIPLLYLLLVGVAVIWIYRSVVLDFQMINHMKSRDGINPILEKDKDNIIVFITTVNIVLWILAIALIYFLPYWDLSFMTDMFYDYTGADKLKEPLYILLILVVSSANIFIRHQLLLFYNGGFEYQVLNDFYKSFLVTKIQYIKSYLVILLATTLSALIYKQFVLDLFFKLRKAISFEKLVNLPLMVNRVDVLRAMPSLLFLFLISSLFFSPLIFYIYKRILQTQYDFHKQQYLKKKRKKEIDENGELSNISDNMF